MKFFEDYRFTQQVRSQVRRHGFWAMRNRSPDWTLILEKLTDCAGAEYVPAAADWPEIYGDEPAADSWPRNREGYGLLLANEKVGWVVGCLPVGETWFCGDSRGSFFLLETALEAARRHATGWDLEIAGIYHTNSCIIRPAAISELVPPGFSDFFLYIRPGYGGWGTCFEYVAGESEDGDFERLEIRRDVALNLRRRWNQRRILKGWRERWGQSEYLGGRTPAAIENRAAALAEALPAERERQSERAKALERDYPRRHLTPPSSEGTRLGTWKHSPRVEIDDSADPLERYLLDAIREERTVEFTFFGTEETTRRRVRPIRLFRVADFDRTYLDTYCETRQAPRTFSLHRIARGSIPGFQADPPKTESTAPRRKPSRPSETAPDRWKETLPFPFVEADALEDWIDQNPEAILWFMAVWDRSVALTIAFAVDFDKSEMQGLPIAAVDIDQLHLTRNEALANRLKIRTSNCVVRLSKGTVLWNRPGVFTKADFESWLKGLREALHG